MKMITRTITILMVLALFITAGCSKTQPSSTAEGGAVKAGAFDTAPVNTTLIQASPSGVVFMLCNGIAESLNKTYPGSLLNITPGSPTSNVIRLVNGDAEFVITYNSSALATLEGKGSQPHPELKGVAALKTSPFQFVMKNDIDAVTFEDILANKLKVRLCIGLADSMSEQAFKQILQQYNLTVDDMQNWGCVFVNKGIDDTEALFANGAIDGYFYGISTPNPSIMRNAKDKPMKFITIDPQAIDAVCDAYGYEKITVPAGTYSFQTEDYNTFTDYLILATTDKCSDATAYKMIRAIHQNLDYITLIHANLKDLTEDSMVNKLKIPIHPGALQYYEEAGLIKS